MFHLKDKEMENLTKEDKKTISIVRTFNLPLKTVWKGWSEPESLKLWFSPEGYTCPSSMIEFKVGGKFLNSMRESNGKETWSTGTYEEIVPFKKIVYLDSFANSEGNIVPASYYKMPGKWDLQLRVTVEFEEVDGKTKMKLRHEDLPIDAADDCVEGWQSCFDKLEKNLK